MISCNLSLKEPIATRRNGLFARGAHVGCNPRVHEAARLLNRLRIGRLRDAELHVLSGQLHDREIRVADLSAACVFVNDLMRAETSNRDRLSEEDLIRVEFAAAAVNFEGLRKIVRLTCDVGPASFRVDVHVGPKIGVAVPMDRAQLGCRKPLRVRVLHASDRCRDFTRDRLRSRCFDKRR